MFCTLSVCFSKVSFIAMVINCSAEMERESQEINVVVAAAEKYLGEMFPLKLCSSPGTAAAE